MTALATIAACECCGLGCRVTQRRVNGYLLWLCSACMRDLAAETAEAEADCADGWHRAAGDSYADWCDAFIRRTVDAMVWDISPARTVRPERAERGQPIRLRDTMAAIERQLVSRAVTVAGGNKSQAARLLGINRTTLVEKLKKWRTA